MQTAFEFHQRTIALEFIVYLPGYTELSCEGFSFVGEYMARSVKAQHLGAESGHHAH